MFSNEEAEEAKFSGKFSEDTIDEEEEQQDSLRTDDSEMLDRLAVDANDDVTEKDDCQQSQSLKGSPMKFPKLQGEYPSLVQAWW